MKVALLGNLEQSAVTESNMLSERWDNRGSWDRIQAITIALEKAGHQAIFLEGNETLYNNLEAVKPDICFNICEGYSGDSPEAQIPAILELLRIPYTGSRILTLALAHDKSMTRRVLAYHGLPTPPFQLFRHEDEPLDPDLQFPLAVKLKRKIADEPLTAGLIVHDESHLRDEMRPILAQFGQHVIVEQVMEGREVTIGMVGNLKKGSSSSPSRDEKSQFNFQGLHLFPPLEFDVSADQFGKVPANSYRTRAEMVRSRQYTCPALLEKALIDILNRLAVTTFQVMDCLDVAQVDFRLDTHNNGKPYIVDVNPLPDLSPAHAALSIEATTDGWSYEDLIRQILDEAAHRHRIQLSHSQPSTRPELKLF